MKIGLITFHNSNNYGAVLQTLSTQKSVEKLGYNIEVLDYICFNKRNWYKSFKVSKNPIKMLSNIIDYPYLTIKNRRFNEFVDKNYNLTKETFYNLSDLRNVEDTYAAFITGSDQVWNPINTGFDKAYFLDFITDSNKKISYAASFGISDIPRQYHQEYKRVLNNIRHLSTREVRGQELVEELVEKESKVVLDPTLLLTKEEWIEFSSSCETRKKPYILLYTVNNSTDCNNYAIQLGKMLGLEVVKINSSTKDCFGRYKTTIATPEEYVSLFYNAEFVVTNSFHGLAFSINLNKEFYVFLGKTIKSNSRMENLLCICNLENRIINEDSDVKLPEENINYIGVNSILEQERSQSIAFLENSLHKAINQ